MMHPNLPPHEVISGTDLLSGVPVVDSVTNYPASLVARPDPGEAINDPEFSSRIVRITDAAASPQKAIVPMYPSTHAWNADESLMILYEPGIGHRTYEGQPPYGYLGSFNWPTGQDAPTDIENIHWDPIDPNIYRYPNLKGQLIEVSISPLEFRVLRDFSDLCQGQKLLMEPHGRPSWAWGDRSWGFSTAQPGTSTKLIWAYDMVEDRILWQYEIPLPGRWIESTPMPTPTGQYFVVQADDVLQVVDRQGQVVGFIGHLDGDGYMQMQEPGHSSLGMIKTVGEGYDMWVTVNFDPPVEYFATLIAYFTRLITPYQAYRYVGQERGYPYPPSGTHHSALTANWVWTSIKGNEVTGQTLLDNEVLLTNLVDGRVGRIAHHRSAVDNNPNYPNHYWQEPHITTSPSGTRAVFGSDWSVGLEPAAMYDTVETYVVELPAYEAPS
jgi:hypothetical protein